MQTDNSNQMRCKGCGKDKSSSKSKILPVTFRSFPNSVTLMFDQAGRHYQSFLLNSQPVALETEDEQERRRREGGGREEGAQRV